VYASATLEPGDTVAGPAAAETEYSTIVIPPGLRACTMHGLADIESRKSGHR
jgi:N-methylhydantoinase A/oxoprolinase/acetone carboxylase beta subunit